jgi:hypothetical protein
MMCKLQRRLLGIPTSFFTHNGKNDWPLVVCANRRRHGSRATDNGAGQQTPVCYPFIIAYSIKVYVRA